MRRSWRALTDLVRKIQPTGPDGLEGAISIALSRLTGFRFRICGSGTQFGGDAATDSGETAIVFEAKRYESKVGRRDAIGAFADASLTRPELDVWILAATCVVGDQTVQTLQQLSEEMGVDVQVLDWGNSSRLGDLAVLLAFARSSVSGWLIERVNGASLHRKGIESDLDQIRKDVDFEPSVRRLREALSGPRVGVEPARTANDKLYWNAFESRAESKRLVGSVLNPRGSRLTVKSRVEYESSVCDAMTESPDGSILCVLGSEGAGKSWVVANSWCSIDSPRPVLVYLRSHQQSNDWRSDAAIDDQLASAISEQTGDNTRATTQTWKRRFRRWANHAHESPTAVFVIDGINQNPGFPWPHFLDAMALRVGEFGAKLILTSRTEFFEREVDPSIEAKRTRVTVDEWSQTERDELLAASGIAPSRIPARARQSLCNPRLLGLAVDLLAARTADVIEITQSCSCSSTFGQWARANRPHP